jgi:hypothetical protein
MVLHSYRWCRPLCSIQSDDRKCSVPQNRQWHYFQTMFRSIPVMRRYVNCSCVRQSLKVSINQDTKSWCLQITCNNRVSSRNNRSVLTPGAGTLQTSRSICLHFFPTSAVRGVHVSLVVPHLFTGRWLAYDWLPSLNTSTGRSVETLTFKFGLLNSQYCI